MRTVTCVLPMCRIWRVEAMAEQFKQLDLTDIKLEILLIVDSTEISRETINSYYENLQYTIIHTDLDPPGEANTYARRQHITDNLNLARQQPIKSEYIWLLEDDTQYPPETLQLLLSDPAPGITSGIQAGRHGVRMLGAWHITDNNYQSLNPKLLGQKQVKVEATGLYCCILKTELFKQHPFTYNPDLPIGPDVLYGQTLKLQHTILLDLKLGHVSPQHTIWPNKDCQQITFKKHNNQWETTIN